jgi:2-polyprenyl-3-methyl-5-hydroxy-6-metoxy-1,4-benzoquinol methylase
MQIGVTCGQRWLFDYPLGTPKFGKSFDCQLICLLAQFHSQSQVCFQVDELNIVYQPLSMFPGWGGAPFFLESLIEQYNCSHILEVGSGANPTLAPAYVRDRGISCLTSDLEPQELEKADSAFERLVIDLSSPCVRSDLVGQFDCVFSRMVGEHVEDGRQFHKNIYNLLRRGGISVHCLSTLWCLPFTANRFLPEFISARLLNSISPRDGHKHGKFPARYSWGRGPTNHMIHRFEELGFEVVNYTGYFGHHYYTNRFPLLHRAEMLKADLLLRWPMPHLCSYASIVLRKH